MYALGTIDSAMRYIIEGYNGPIEDFYESGLKHWNDMKGALQEYGGWYENYYEMTALEIGCGIGRLTLHIAGDFRRVFAMDVSDNMIRHAVAIPNVTYGIGENLDGLADDSIDYVLSMIVMQHMPKWAFWNYLSDSWRVLRPGGIFCTQMHLGGMDWPDTETLGVRGYSGDELTAGLFVEEGAGRGWKWHTVMGKFGFSEPWNWLILEKQ